MKLLKASMALVGTSAVILVGWVFLCFLLLASLGVVLWKWPAVFSQQNFAVLGADDQQLNLPFDERIALLEQFLNEQNSPLASQAATMIEAADTYKFDWRLLPAIAGKESSFGKKIPWDKENGESSHNAWGWGVYGQKAPSFSSWEEAIASVAAGLRHEYYNKGYVTPELIMKRFTPRSDGSWAQGVRTIMEQISSEN